MSDAMERTKVPIGRAVRTVFLDRDGVINEKAPEGEYIRRAEDLKLLPGAAAAIARLNRAGVRVVVVTNQRGVALGYFSQEDVLKIEATLEKMLADDGARLDGFYFCPHDEGACNCRKPLPGLFDQARADFSEIDPASSVMIGDSLSDIEFGQNLGMRTIFIEGPAKLQRSGAERARELADARFMSVVEALDALLNCG
ncbi:MAG TPA: HAD family hydrolase [Bryobacteraceae bacterium]|nr:HAD family hydrolase [Bryobacteraceae bacterium]